MKGGVKSIKQQEFANLNDTNRINGHALDMQWISPLRNKHKL